MSQHSLNLTGLPGNSINGVNNVNGVNPVNNINLGGQFDMNLPVMSLPTIPLSNVVSNISIANFSMKQENLNSDHYSLDNTSTYELSHHFHPNNSPDTAAGDGSNNNVNNNNNNNQSNTPNSVNVNNPDFSRLSITNIGDNNNNNQNSNNNNNNNGNNNQNNQNNGNNGNSTSQTNDSHMFDTGMEGDDDDDDIDNADIDDDLDQTGAAPPKKKRKISNGMAITTQNGQHTHNGKHKPVKEWRKSTHAQTSEKMKKAIKFLDEFRAEHNNKLPSLRAIMKMMKVGFPKAHEILNSYAAHVQIPKHVLMQDMVVRQERAKEDETPPRSKSRGRRGGGGAGTRREGKPTTDSDEESNCSSSEAVNQALKEMIVRILRLTNSINKQEYYEECKKLEELVKQFEPNYNEYGVNDRLRLAQSYFLLGSMYRERNERNEAYSYVEKALSTFRDCNTQAQSFGYNVQLPDDQTAQDANVSSDDIGHFWPQIFEVYILGGHVLLANSQYPDAKTMYELARDLARYIDGAYKVTVSEALENLAVVSMYMNDVESSIEYTKQIIEVLSKQNVRQIKIFNAKAYYACCLTLSNDPNNVNEGLKVYKEVISGAESMFGSEDPSTLGFYCYFGLHWVQIKDFNKAQEHIEKVLNVSRPLKAFERKVVHDLLNDFVESVIGSNEIGRLQNLFQWQIENATNFNKDQDTAPDKRIDIYQLHLNQARSYAKVHEFSKSLSIYNHVLRSIEGTPDAQRKNELAAEIQQIQAQQQQMVTGVAGVVVGQNGNNNNNNNNNNINTSPTRGNNNILNNSQQSPPVINNLNTMPVFGAVGGFPGVPNVGNLPPMPQPIPNGNNNNNNNNNNNMNVNGVNLSSGPPIMSPNGNTNNDNDNNKNVVGDNNGNNEHSRHQQNTHSHSTSSNNTNGTRTTSDATQNGNNAGMHGMPPPPPPGAYNYPFQNGN